VSTAGTPPILSIEDLHVEADGSPILRGVTLEVGAGEIHTLMGPNGSGKSTLANALLANPAYTVTSGRIVFRGEDVTACSTDERAARGMFLGFQHPEEIAGVSVLNFLRQAMAVRKGIPDLSVLEVRMALMQWTARLGMDDRFQERYLNEGFSGGERKRNEILQMALMEPDLAILERESRPDLGVLLITHYQRILEHLTPDRVHVLVDGRIVAVGGPELAARVESEGFDAFRTAAA
jgi:Fe-S cluster assembly ATP-binding protein